MLNIKIAVSLTTVLLLCSACNQPTRSAAPPSAAIVIPTSQLPAVVRKVQAYASKYCTYLPTAVTVSRVAEILTPDEVDAVLNGTATFLTEFCSANGSYASLGRGPVVFGEFRGIPLVGTPIQR